jgi:hypothetical protein
LSGLICIERFKEALDGEYEEETNLLIKSIMRIYLQNGAPLEGFSNVLNYLSELLSEALEVADLEHSLEEVFGDLKDRIEDLAGDFDMDIVTSKAAVTISHLIERLIPFDRDQADDLGIKAVAEFARIDFCELLAKEIGKPLAEIESAQEAAWEYIGGTDDEE